MGSVKLNFLFPYFQRFKLSTPHFLEGHEVPLGNLNSALAKSNRHLISFISKLIISQCPHIPQPSSLNPLSRGFLAIISLTTEWGYFMLVSSLPLNHLLVSHLSAFLAHLNSPLLALFSWERHMLAQELQAEELWRGWRNSAWTSTVSVETFFGGEEQDGWRTWEEGLFEASHPTALSPLLHTPHQFHLPPCHSMPLVSLEEL